ncbi:MAG: hypothetical protein CSB49_00250, partial [Proteobacteria bacterium]
MGHQKRDPKGMAKNATIKNPKNAKRPSNATLDPNATAKEVQRKAQNKRVFGEVRAILKAKHSPLPELERKPTDSKENPGAQIVNDTPYGLTVWFAGPCSDKVEVQAKGNAEIRFCPGTYHIAAKVESPVFLPLVRESQDFELGIDYVLKIIIRAEPKTIIKRY